MSYEAKCWPIKVSDIWKMKSTKMKILKNLSKLILKMTKPLKKFLRSQR